MEENKTLCVWKIGFWVLLCVAVGSILILVGSTFSKLEKVNNATETIKQELISCNRLLDHANDKVITCENNAEASNRTIQDMKEELEARSAKIAELQVKNDSTQYDRQIELSLGGKSINDKIQLCLMKCYSGAMTQDVNAYRDCEIGCKQIYALKGEEGLNKIIGA